MSLETAPAYLGLFVLWFAACEGTFWLACRLGAKRCPRCDSKWRTELHGEWGGELWTRRACGHCWEAP